MKFASVDGGAAGLLAGRGRHARGHQGAAARRAAASRATAASSPAALMQTTVGRVMFNTMLPEGMPFYNTPLRSSDLAGVISDCYEILGRRATIDLLDDAEPPRLPPEHAQRPELRHRRPDHAAQQAEDHRQRREGGAARSEALPARHHHRGRALQPGARRLDPRPRADHHRNDDRAGERLSLPRLRQPDLPDGPLRCPRRRRADSPVGRHARFDGQAVGQDHRDADQGQLPRGPDACWSTSAPRTVPARVWPTRP